MIKMREARFWPKMKFEPIFFQVLWWFTFSFPLSGEADGGSGIHPTQNGRGEIRTRDSLRYIGVRDQRLKPLGHPTIKNNFILPKITIKIKGE